mmetsp:Transcript_8429/g.28291  ORF Transcript_8429/g.28291 Transcript_8429/m.28291 type:complete len:84 (+) Transcript_8429:3112-3363(+)
MPTTEGSALLDQLAFLKMRMNPAIQTVTKSRGCRLPVSSRTRTATMALRPPLFNLSLRLRHILFALLSICPCDRPPVRSFIFM